MLEAQDARRQVARLIELMGAPIGARVLDVACGQGRHATLLAEAGYEVDAVDQSAHLIARGKKLRGDVSAGRVRFQRCDMRRLPPRWTGRFDVVLNLATSFGFFRDAADDARAVAEMARVLAPGGTLIWHGASRDGVMARFVASDWWPTSDGSMIGHRRQIDLLSGVLTVESTRAGKAGTDVRSYTIRLYTATRLAEMLAAAGLVVVEALSGWSDRPLGRRSGEMLLVARRLDELPRVGRSK